MVTFQRLSTGSVLTLPRNTSGLPGVTLSAVTGSPWLPDGMIIQSILAGSLYDLMLKTGDIVIAVGNTCGPSMSCCDGGVSVWRADNPLPPPLTYVQQVDIDVGIYGVSRNGPVCFICGRRQPGHTPEHPFQAVHPKSATLGDAHRDYFVLRDFCAVLIDDRKYGWTENRVYTFQLCINSETAQRDGFTSQCIRFTFVGGMHGSNAVSAITEAVAFAVRTAVYTMPLFKDGMKITACNVTGSYFQELHTISDEDFMNQFVSATDNVHKVEVYATAPDTSVQLLAMQMAT